MKRYEVRLTLSAQRQLRKLPADVLARLRPVLRALAEDPRPSGVTKLSNEDNAWRVRMGDYRIIYEIHDKVLLVLVVDVDHRRDVYRKR